MGLFYLRLLKTINGLAPQSSFINLLDLMKKIKCSEELPTTRMLIIGLSSQNFGKVYKISGKNLDSFSLLALSVGAMVL